MDSLSSSTTDQTVLVKASNNNLGKKPDFIIVKRTANQTGWELYHSAVGATRYGKINATLAWPDDDSRWYDTEPR